METDPFAIESIVLRQCGADFWRVPELCDRRFDRASRSDERV